MLFLSQQRKPAAVFKTSHHKFLEEACACLQVLFLHESSRHAHIRLLTVHSY